MQPSVHQGVPDPVIRFSSKAMALAVVGAVAFPGAALASTDVALLPRNLSPWNMFVSADLVVQGVMVGLAIASLVTCREARYRLVSAFKAPRNKSWAIRCMASRASRSRLSASP